MTRAKAIDQGAAKMQKAFDQPKALRKCACRPSAAASLPRENPARGWNSWQARKASFNIKHPL
jgi:hypothetical protein